LQGIHVRRLKARFEYDPSSLNATEIECLKEYVEKSDGQMQRMETSGWKSSIKNITNAVLAPETFIDKMILEPEEGEKDLGYHRQVPTNAKGHIVEHPELSRKKMVPMKMDGDELTWNDVKNALIDPESYVIDDDCMDFDEEPCHLYGQVAAKDDNDSNVDDEDINIVRFLQTELKELTKKVSMLESHVKTKDAESQLWRQKAEQLEKENDILREKIKDSESNSKSKLFDHEATDLYCIDRDGANNIMEKDGDLLGLESNNQISIESLETIDKNIDTHDRKTVHQQEDNHKLIDLSEQNDLKIDDEITLHRGYLACENYRKFP